MIGTSMMPQWTLCIHHESLSRLHELASDFFFPSFLLVVSRPTAGMSYVFSENMATPIQLNGTVAMLVNILLYASPLSTIGLVIKTRNSASIFLPWTFAALGCSFTWFLYGVATKQVPVIVPHSFGLVLNLLQLVLRLIFPTIQ